MASSRPKTILAIETSCDESAIAVAEFRTGRGHMRTSSQTNADNGITVKVRSHIVSSQTKIHAAYGGVVPNLARREHEKNLVPILLAVLREAAQHRNSKRKTKNAKLQSKSQNAQALLTREPVLSALFQQYIIHLPPPDIDAIAVTVGPGLAPALWVGVNFARALATLWHKPLIPVNHMAGHFFSAFLQKSGHSGRSRLSLGSDRLSLERAEFPILGLLVSGGHTELVLVKKPWKFQIIGETQDDAVGEVFDKVGRILKLPYPGGPKIAQLALKGNPRAYALPRPMLHTKDYNFSFSGLKTAVLYLVRDIGNLTPQKKKDISASFQAAAVEALVKKTIRAAKEYKAKTILLGGGVSANAALRAALAAAIKRELPNSKLQVPSSELCGDNALMIATAAYFCGKKKPATEVRADANLTLG